jgi:hypothetical protein
MIIERMMRADMDQLIGREPRRHGPRFIQEARWPPPAVRLHTDPLGPQRIKLAWQPILARKQLHIAIAVEQHMDRHRLQQRLPRRRRRHQRNGRRIRAREGHRCHPFCHHPHRPLSDDIGEIAIAHLRLIAPRPFAERRISRTERPPQLHTNMGRTRLCTPGRFSAEDVHFMGLSIGC